MPDSPSAACSPITTTLSPSPSVSQGGLSFLVHHFADCKRSGRRGCWVPCVPRGGLGSAHPSSLVCLPLPCSAPARLSLAAKSRAILLPMDLDAHMSALLSSGGSCSAAAQRSAANYKTATRTFPRVIPTANQWDYKNIIEKLQVGVAAQPPRKGPLQGGGGVGGWGRVAAPQSHCLVSSGWDMVTPWSSRASW